MAHNVTPNPLAMNREVADMYSGDIWTAKAS